MDDTLTDDRLAVVSASSSSDSQVARSERAAARGGASARPRSDWRRPERGRRLRRGYPVRAYVGPLGSGKTLAMVWDAIPSLLAGRPVLSTVRLLDFQNPRLCDDPSCKSPNHGVHMAAHPLYTPLTEWGQLLDARHCDVLADEITGVASSREYASMPAPIVNVLQQLRRRDVTFAWTAPAWARADSVLRSVTAVATLAQGYAPQTMRSDDERVWRPRRWFTWKTYDASLLDDFENGKRDKIKQLRFDSHWGPGSPAFACYDTLDDVGFINTISDTGRCLHCGKRRKAEYCAGH